MIVRKKLSFLGHLNIRQWIQVFRALISKPHLLGSFYQYFNYLYFFNGEFLKYKDNYTHSRIDKLSPGKLKLRLGNSSDLLVFQQVFYWKEYKTAIKIFEEKFSAQEALTIMDCGANIGLTTVLFKQSFKQSRIITLEPNLGNFDVLCFNLKEFNGITNVNAGIWSKKTKLGSVNGLRDNKEWSFRLDETEDKSIQVFKLSDLINKYKLEIIDILKIDIEGAEREIFGQKKDMNFLNITKCLIIEIHDELVSRELINSILNSYNFKLQRIGELTIAINKSFSEYEN